MKKLLFLLALLVLPLTAAAQVSDMLLSSSGALYTISTETPAATDDSQALAQLVLTEQRGDVTVREVVPATTVRGSHRNALLGYDSESGTLFVFWIQHFGFLFNQLLFCTRDQYGNWSEATAFGSPYNYRENLRIAVTRKVTDVTDGSVTPGLVVHATWWEFDAQTGLESPQYRMLPIENGHVVAEEVTDVDLRAFVDLTAVGPEDIDPAVLKYPMLSPSAQQDSVLLVYGSRETRTFTKVRVTPSRGVKADGRLRVPVGKSEGGFRAPNFPVSANSTLEGVFNSDSPAAFYTVDGNSLRYKLLNGGEWSETRAVALDEKITSTAAVNALRKMINEQ
jgi:hypothetical protein